MSELSQEERDQKIMEWVGSFYRPQKLKREPRIPRRGYVYLLSCNGLYKIGCSTDVDKRIKSLSTGSASEITKEHIILSNDMYDLEKTLKHQFRENHVRGEWFSLTDSQVQQIKSILRDDE